MAALGFWQAGLIAAVPAATGLTVLAASDLTTHRFSLKTLRLATALVAGGLVVDTRRSSAWERLVAGVAVAGLVALAVLALWLSTAGIAPGCRHAPPGSPSSSPSWSAAASPYFSDTGDR